MAKFSSATKLESCGQSSTLHVWRPACRFFCHKNPIQRGVILEQVAAHSAREFTLNVPKLPCWFLVLSLTRVNFMLASQRMVAWIRARSNRFTVPTATLILTRVFCGGTPAKDCWPKDCFVRNWRPTNEKIDSTFSTVRLSGKKYVLWGKAVRELRNNETSSNQIVTRD